MAKKTARRLAQELLLSLYDESSRLEKIERETLAKASPRQLLSYLVVDANLVEEGHCGCMYSEECCGDWDSFVDEVNGTTALYIAELFKRLVVEQPMFALTINEDKS